jgi:Na+/phosphate symporter
MQVIVHFTPLFAIAIMQVIVDFTALFAIAIMQVIVDFTPLFAIAIMQVIVDFTPLFATAITQAKHAFMRIIGETQRKMHSPILQMFSHGGKNAVTPAPLSSKRRKTVYKRTFKVFHSYRPLYNTLL